MLITDEYRALNRQLHETRDDYGRSGKRWAGMVQNFADALNTHDILDYGCGKRTLSDALPHLLITNYDPCIPGYDDPPQPHDLVICGDVLEHIEPECLDAVLDDLKRLTKQAIFMVIATRPAAKTLADGRNAHLIVQPYEWWLEKIMARWGLRLFQHMGGEFAVMAVREIEQ